jgi:hypothetical protein
MSLNLTVADVGASFAVKTLATRVGWKARIAGKWITGVGKGLGRAFRDAHKMEVDPAEVEWTGDNILANS